MIIHGAVFDEKLIFLKENVGILLIMKIPIINKFTKLKNYIYYNIFVERFTKKINFKFPSNFYRWDMIKFLQSKKQFKNYLEIGCDQDQLFSKINIENKRGF